jgi:hypothetical protein
VEVRGREREGGDTLVELESKSLPSRASPQASGRCGERPLRTF